MSSESASDAVGRNGAAAPGVARAAAGRVGALMTSVMDLHVRMALQEVDREKRRLISGALFVSGAVRKGKRSGFRPALGLRSMPAG